MRDVAVFVNPASIDAHAKSMFKQVTPDIEIEGWEKEMNQHSATSENGWLGRFWKLHR